MYQYAETYEGEVTHDTHGPTKVSSAIEQVDIGTSPKRDLTDDITACNNFEYVFFYPIVFSVRNLDGCKGTPLFYVFHSFTY